MVTLASQTRRKCFISYHHADEDEVQQFIQQFDHDRDVLIARGIGASMSGDIIDSTNTEYIKQQIRAKYLRDTTVTIVLIGQETWKRRFVTGRSLLLFGIPLRPLRVACWVSPCRLRQITQASACLTVWATTWMILTAMRAGGSIRQAPRASPT